MRSDKHKRVRKDRPLVYNQDAGRRYDTGQIDYGTERNNRGQAVSDQRQGEDYQEYRRQRQQGAEERKHPSAQRSQSKKQKKKKNKALKIVLLILFILVVAVGAVIGASLTIVHDKLDKVSQVDVNRGDLAIDPQVAKDLKNYRNIALLGIDARDMDNDDQVRSDAMIIASIDKRTSDVRLISLYRDTYLDLGENYGLDKLTHAYSFGKATQTLQSINRNLDMNCEEVVVVNWKSVADTVDALGGINVDIQESEIKEMNKYIKDTQKNIGGSKASIERAGLQTLNGNQAVTYARIRKDSAEGDYRRNERMKIVLKAAFDKAKTLSLSDLNHIADQILPTVKTNITTNEMMEMVLKITAYNITETEGWPFTTEGWRHNGVWYGPPITLKSNVSELHEKYFEQPDYVPTQRVTEISDRISSVTGWW